MEKITKEKALSALEVFTDNIQTVILSTVSKDGEPFASYSPFVEDEEGNYYVYISTAVQHSHNMYATKKAHILFIEDESDAAHIYARRRLYFKANAEKFDEDDPNEEKILQMFKEKFGEAVSFFPFMKDFRVYKLIPYDGNLVLGFGAAFKISPDKKEVYLNDKGHSKKHEDGLTKGNK